MAESPDALKREDCPTHLLRDAPAEEDSFGPHAAIATAIASLIQTEAGGISVGLSGPWGSGKSTVVRLIQSQFAGSPDTNVWLFDAWSHRGDPLRRTFLEKLISHLSEVGWVDAKDWKQRSEALAGRRKVAEQRTYSRLSRLGMALAASLFLVPFGSSLFSEGLKLGVSLLPNAGPINYRFVLGVLLGAAPLWVALATCAKREFAYWFRRFGGGNPPRPDYRQVLALIVQRAEVDVRTETIETPEPTSLEFEAVFADLMTDALRVQSRRLILVVDNLDRIDGGEALTIWSTLQTFLQHNSPESQWLSRVWVVMPFDSMSISRLWLSTPGSKDGLAASFLDKTFQVRFEVPPAPTSDWRDYLMAQLRAALPRHGDEFQTIYRLIAVLFGAPNRVPTPRELKLIVNHIGALHRQHGHAVSLDHMAYYVLLCRESKPVVKGLLDGDVPAETVASLVGDGVRDSLAALALGVDKKRARQLLLEVPILTALAEGDTDALKGLVGASEGFPEVLEQAVQRACVEWPKKEAGKLLNAAVALADSGLLDSGEAHRANGLVSSLIATARSLTSLAPITERAERGLQILSIRSGAIDVATHLFSTYAQEIGSLPPDEPHPGLPQRILDLAKHLDDAGLGSATSSGVALPGGLPRYFAALRDLRADYDNSVAGYWSVLRPQAETDAIPKSIKQTIDSGQLGTEHVDGLRLFRGGPVEPPWELVIAALGARLNAGVGANADEVTSLLDALIALSDAPTASETIESLIEAGHIAHHVYAAGSSSAIGALARCIYLLGRQESAFAPPRSHAGQSQAGQQQLQQYLGSPSKGLPEALAEFLSSLRDRGWLFACLSSNATCEPLVGKITAALMKGDRTYDLFTPQDIVENWHLFDEYADPQRILSHFGHGLAKEVRSGSLEGRLPVVLALMTIEPVDDALLNWVTEQLQSVPKDKWVDELRVGDSYLTLAVACARRGRAIELGGAFRQALGELAQGIANDGLPTEVNWAPEAGLVCSLLDATNRRVLRSDLTRVLSRDQGKTSAAFFHLFGNEIGADQRLRTERTFPTDVGVPLLGARNQAGLEWLYSLLEKDSELLRAADEDSRRAFETDLARALRDGLDDPAQHVVGQIAAILGIQADPSQEPEQKAEGSPTM